MPYLILYNEEGGMSEAYIVGNDNFIKAITSDRHWCPEDTEMATKFAEKSQIGDFVSYSKGMVVRVNTEEDVEVRLKDIPNDLTRIIQDRIRQLGNAVDDWHSGDLELGLPIHEYLGLSEKQYALYVEDEEALVRQIMGIGK